MNKLNKDELLIIALEFSLPDLLNFCQSNKRFNDLVCNRNDIWYIKLQREFDPKTISYFSQDTPRKTYIFLYKLTELRKQIPSLQQYSLIDLYELKKLNLDNNKLTTLPESLGNLVNLKIYR